MVIVDENHSMYHFFLGWGGGPGVLVYVYWAFWLLPGVYRYRPPTHIGRPLCISHLFRLLSWGPIPCHMYKKKNKYNCDLDQSTARFELHSLHGLMSIESCSPLL